MRNLTLFFAFIGDLFKSKKLIFELTKNDLKKRFLGSQLGVVWAFVQPALTIFIFWFVIQKGFRQTSPQGVEVPFILWITAGILPWFFFSESLANATNSILEYSYLVSKVVFRVSVLPIIKILSALFVHIFFIIILFIMFGLYGYKPNIYNIQVIYYLFAAIVLLLGISWATSALMVFIREIGQIVAVIIQFGFWMTPIFWNINTETIPLNVRNLLKLNPVYYIVEGYRNTFIYHRWFWEDPYLTIYFWGSTLVIFIAGAFFFRRLRPNFADVL